MRKRFGVFVMLSFLAFAWFPSIAKADIPSIDLIEMSMNTCFSDSANETADSKKLHTVVDIQQLYGADGKTLLFTYVPGNYITSDENDTIDDALSAIHNKYGTYYDKTSEKMMTYTTKDMNTGGIDKIVIEKFKLKDADAAKRYSESVDEETQKEYSELVIIGNGVTADFVNYVKSVVGTPVEKYDYTKDVPVEITPEPIPAYDNASLYTAVAQSLGNKPATGSAIDSELIVESYGKTGNKTDIKALYKNATGESVTINLTEQNQYRSRNICPAGKYQLVSVAPKEQRKAFPDTILINGETELPIIISESSNLWYRIVLIITVVAAIAIISGCLCKKHAKR